MEKAEILPHTKSLYGRDSQKHLPEILPDLDRESLRFLFLGEDPADLKTQMTLIFHVLRRCQI